MATWDGHARRKARARCFAEQGTICYLCGHDGSRDIDHIVPKSKGGALFDQDNLAPAHGARYPCSTCGRRCNREKADKALSTGLSTSRDWYT